MKDRGSLTGEGKKRAEKTRQRIKALIAGNGKTAKTTIKGLADDLGIGESSLRGYISGRQLLSQRVADKLYKLTNTPAAYWMGEADSYTREEYMKELQKHAQEQGDTLKRETDRILEEREILFQQLGYRYEWRPSVGMAFLDVISEMDPEQGLEIIAEADPEKEGTHLLIDYGEYMAEGEDKYIELSSEELEDLIRELKSTLEYHLYKLRKRRG
ncbi:MAG: hypothetical protein IKF59_05945 [Lachnospiraceae bacterium]|nr:hypothetical protein [Lachnospiraceae bacterium]